MDFLKFFEYFGHLNYYPYADIPKKGSQFIYLYVCSSVLSRKEKIIMRLVTWILSNFSNTLVI